MAAENTLHPVRALQITELEGPDGIQLVETTEPAVAEQRAHVRVPRDEPLLCRLVPADRCCLAQLLMGRVRRRNERRRPRVELVHN